MDEVRAYQYKNLEGAGIDVSAYSTMCEADTVTGMLNVKAWGKTANMKLFVTLADECNIIAAAWRDEDGKRGLDYLGADDIPIGAEVELVFEKARTGRINLVRLTRISMFAQ